MQLLQRPFWSIPGCEHVFVLQLLHFSPRHGDDNVVDVVHAHSLAFTDKPLEGNGVDVIHILVISKGFCRLSTCMSGDAHELVVQLVARCVFHLRYHFTHFTVVPASNPVICVCFIFWVKTQSAP